MSDTDKTPVDDPVSRHPMAARMRRAIQAHPILKLQKKLVVEVEGNTVSVTGSVYTISMHRQLVELAGRVAGEDAHIEVDARAEIQPPAGRELEGRVPPVSPGAGATKSAYSTNHLKK